jgi:RNA polymerase sigma-70 factor (TIGR02960 family)
VRLGLVTGGAGVTREKTARDDETKHLIVAQGGDERAFEALTQPLRRELHLHCYRMLGTLDDADDALQETLMRAWRNLDRFEPRAPFRAWLYRIATNVCLTTLARRTRRGEIALTDLSNERERAPWREDEPLNLHPYPDDLIDELAQAIPGPETTVVQRESVELAFVAAVQLLPPRQRATLLLRDVIGYPAAEVAAMLETSLAGVNSALQRARATLAQAQTFSPVTRPHTPPSSETEQALVQRLVAAWQAVDVPGIVAILTEDALFSMPPLPDHYVGREAIAAFLATGPAGGRLDRFRLVPTRANCQPALAAYWRDGDEGPFHAHGIIVIAFDKEAIASLTRFADPALFSHFGLPMTIDGHSTLP